MKIREGFILRQVSEAYVVVAVGEAAQVFNGMITLNESGALLWKALSDGCTDEKALVRALLAEYEVTEEQAEKDVKAFVKHLSEANILEN